MNFLKFRDEKKKEKKKKTQSNKQTNKLLVKFGNQNNILP